MQYMVIVECVSSGRLYVDDIISHGYKPLVVNYVASALGCVLFAMIFGLFSKTGDLLNVSPHELGEGFLPTMIFSVILLVIALLCTLSVKNKVVKKEE